MAFRFQTSENASAGFRRIAVGQIVRARRHLTRGEDRAVAVHEARKCLKRIRALLRLVRPALSKEQFRRENARFRDIARLLATSRDRQVMRDTVARLATGADERQGKALAALNEVLAQDIGTSGAPPDHTVAFEPVIASLSRAKKDFKHLDLELNMKDLIRIGLKRSYRAGQEALAAAKAKPDDETLHEWRKTVQVHWRHMLLLSDAWPEYFAVRSNAAKELSDCLGEDHDLAVLIGFVTNGGGSAIGQAHAEAIVSLADEQQRQLREKAFRKGAFLFAEDARGLANTVRRYWSVARDQSRANDEAPSNAGAAPESTPGREAGAFGRKTVLAE
jgi:hypothetical protein